MSEPRSRSPSTKRDKNYRDPNRALVRLKTPNPRRGLVMRTYSATWKGIHYDLQHTHGWYWVPKAFARYLKTIPARFGVLAGAEGDDDHPRAFHVCETVAEAEAIDARERREEEKRRSAGEARFNDQASDLRTTDLRPMRIDEREEFEDEDGDGVPDEIVKPEKERVVEENLEPTEEDDEETRALLARVKELRAGRKEKPKPIPAPPEDFEEEPRAPRPARPAPVRAPPPPLRERSTRAAPAAEDAPVEPEEAEEAEEEEAPDSNPDINNGGPVDNDFGDERESSEEPPAPVAKKAPAKKTAKKKVTR